MMTLRTLRQAKEMCQSVCGHLPLPGHRVTETNHKVLTVRTPVAEVEAELSRRRILLQPSVGGPWYAVDDHFSKYAYDEIKSAADALRLCDELDEECGGY